MHLLVLAGNTAARRCCERHGSERVETLARPMPDGSAPPVCRRLSRDPAPLLTALPSEE